MSLHYFNRLERLDYLIRTKSTGSPKSLAERLDISERALYDFLNVMKELGAPILYCKKRHTYYYKDKGQFFVKFKKDKSNAAYNEDYQSVSFVISEIIEAEFVIDSSVILMLQDAYS